MENERKQDFWIVAIGSSAGGEKAIEEFFAHLPCDVNAAFLVLQHPSTDFNGSIKDMLVDHTNMDLYLGKDGIKIESNNIYLIPPEQNLVIEGHLFCSAQESASTNSPIDSLFQSLADTQNEQIIGVILSGKGNDGSLGLEAINQAGGLCLSQSPITADYDAMPNNTLVTGVVDHVLSPRELAWFIYDVVMDNNIAYTIDSPSPDQELEFTSLTPVNGILHQALVDIYGSRKATCLLIKPDGTLIHNVTDKLNLLTVPSGRLTHHIMSMLPHDLILPVKTAVNYCYRNQEKITYRNIICSHQGDSKALNLTVGYSKSDRCEQGFLSLVIEEQADITTAYEEEQIIFAEAKNMMLYIHQLEDNLTQTRNGLKAQIQNLQRDNYKYKINNQKLKTKERQLKFAKDESDSQIQQLTQLTTNLENLLHSTELGVVFLDRDLQVRKFTQSVTKVINLLKSDIERPLFHLTHNLENLNLCQLLQEILVTEQYHEQEVKIVDCNDYFLMRVNPYRHESSELVAGLVVSFISINQFKNLEEEITKNTQILNAIYDSAPVGVCLVDQNLEFVYINSVLAELNGKPADEHIGKNIREILPDLANDIVPFYNHVLSSGETLDQIEISIRDPYQPDKLSYWMTSYFPLQEGVAAVMVDITKQKETAAELASNKNRLKHLLSSSPAIIFSVRWKIIILALILVITSRLFWVTRLKNFRGKIIVGKDMYILTTLK